MLVLIFFIWNFSPETERTLYIIMSIAIFTLMLLFYINEKKEQQLEIERQRRILRSGIYDIDIMRGKDFEEFLKLLFDKLGYDAQVTKASGDYGADLVLVKDNKTIVVQAKRSRKSVGIKAVQEVIPSMQIYGAREAWVVSNNYYTKPAINLADAHGVKLIDRDELIHMLLIKEKYYN